MPTLNAPVPELWDVAWLVGQAQTQSDEEIARAIGRPVGEVREAMRRASVVRREGRRAVVLRDHWWGRPGRRVARRRQVLLQCPVCRWTEFVEVEEQQDGLVVLEKHVKLMVAGNAILHVPCAEHKRCIEVRG